MKTGWNSPLLLFGLALYGGLLILFAWQTWEFISWLFPDDMLLMKVLTIVSFDVAAAWWGIVHTFYKFRSRGAHQTVVVTWVVSFTFSLAASILYLCVLSFYRFHIVLSQTWVNVGYVISIVALVWNILAIMSWLLFEHHEMYPKKNLYEIVNGGGPVDKKAKYTHNGQASTQWGGYRGSQKVEGN